MAGVKNLTFRVMQMIWIVLLFSLIAWFLDYNARYPAWMTSDPMAFSGFLAVIFGIGYSILVDRSHANLLSRWHDAAIIELNTDSRREIEKALQRHSIICHVIVVSTLVAVMIFGYTNFYRKFDPFSEFTVVSFTCALLVGMRLARLVNHGSIGRLVEDKAGPFGMTIEHPDRAGGTAQIGKFYFFQATVLVIPVFWLLVWILLIPSLEGYTKWADHFFNLLILAIAMFFLAFVLPMIAFRRLIRDWKRANISNLIEGVRSELINLRSIERPTSVQRRRRAELARHLDGLIHLPDWPVSLATRNAFVTTVLLPLLVNFATSALSS